MEVLTVGPETVSRRTDDVLYDVRHLRSYLIDVDRRWFDPIAEADVLEQEITGVAEDAVHGYGPAVYQDLDEQTGLYMSLNKSTIAHNVRGIRSLKVANFEFLRRVEDVVEEDTILLAEVQAGMRNGGAKIMIRPAPTHQEADPDIAQSFNYDDRATFSIQRLAKDGKRKSMTTFSVFDVPAKAWAAYLSDRFDADIEPTALAVIRFCHRLPLEFADNHAVLQEFIGGVIDYLPEEDRPTVERQLGDFLHQQSELAEQTRYYAQEKMAIKKELAVCLDGWATPKVLSVVNDLKVHLNPTVKQELDKRFLGGRLKVDDFVASLVVKMKAVTVNNRAGLATRNERTFKRVASRMGLDAAIALSQQEQMIQALEVGNQFMARRADQLLAGAGLECRGGCSVDVVDLFSKDAEMAREAGLDADQLYTSEELNRNSKCSCSDKKRARVIVDGKSAVCVTCGDFQVGRRRGNIQSEAKKAA